MKERFLHRVFCIFVIHYNRPGHCIRTSFVSAHQLGKRLAFSLLRREDQRTFVGRSFCH